jgi:hypothetical protein
MDRRLVVGLLEKPQHHPRAPLTAPTPSTSTPCLRNPSGPRYDLHAALSEPAANPPQRQAFARVARQQTGFVARRTFITPTAVRSGDSSPSRENTTVLTQLALQRIWSRNCTSASSRTTRSRKSRPLTPRAPSRPSLSRPPPHRPRSRTSPASSNHTRPSRSMSRVLQAKMARFCPQRTGSRRRTSRSPPLAQPIKRSDAAIYNCIKY